MRELRIDCRQLTDREGTHTYLQRVLPLPEHYGRNLDALYDCLTEMPDTVLVLEHRREVTPYGESAAIDGISCLVTNRISHLRSEILLPVKCLLKQFSIFPSVFVDDMRVNIRHHTHLGMAGISLYGLDVSTVQLKLVSDAGVSETVENDFGKIIITDQLCKSFADLCFTDRCSGGRCEDNSIVMEFRSKKCFHFILGLFVANQHFCNTARKENTADTGFRLGCFENANSFVEFALGREDKNNVFSIKSFNGLL